MSQTIHNVCINQIVIYGEIKDMNKVEEMKLITSDSMNEKCTITKFERYGPECIHMNCKTYDRPPYDFLKELTKKLPDIELQCYFNVRGNDLLVYSKKGEII